MKVVVLTTSFPRHAGDPAGTFVAAAVDGLRAAGVEVDVVSPASLPPLRDRLRARDRRQPARAPWKLALVPAFLVAYARAARRAARDADLVHAHWLPSGLAALATRKPFVVQLWGTDVALARRAPALFRPVLRRARLVLCASSALAEAGRELGAREVRVVPSPVALPERSPGPTSRRTSSSSAGSRRRRASLEFARGDRGAAAVDRRRRPAPRPGPRGGRLRSVGRGRRLYARAAVVCVPSLREGYGMAARRGDGARPAGGGERVGGLVDLVEDGVNGLLVPPGDVAALRAAVVRLLEDPELRARLGAVGRERARERLSPVAAAEATLAAYRDALA